MTTEPRQEAQRIVDRHEEVLIDSYPSHPWGKRYRESERKLVDALAAFIEEKDAEDWYATHCQEPGAAERLHKAYQAGRAALSALREDET